MSESIVTRLARRFDALRPTLASLGPLLARLTLGVIFVQSGLGKLEHHDKVVGFFTELGLPAPGFQAWLVASTELVGGALVLVGLLTRFAALPLAITMVVALLTAKRADIHGFGDLFGTVEWTYLVLLLGLVFTGPGALSLDGPLGRQLRARLGSSTPR